MLMKRSLSADGGESRASAGFRATVQDPLRRQGIAEDGCGKRLGEWMEAVIQLLPT